MPELPDVEIYVERLNALAAGRTLIGLRIRNPFVLRTAEPPYSCLADNTLRQVWRVGKRMVLDFGRHAAVIHLMIAGRLHWRESRPKVAKGHELAWFEFDNGALVLTEAGKRRRASLHIVNTADAAAAFDRGGVEILSSNAQAFWQRIRDENHTIKRALTDQRIVSGIGNAYSDEILHRARMSPFKQTRSLTEQEATTLFGACVSVLSEWTERLRQRAGDGFPENVTAFHADMAVHGHFGKDCPACGGKIQRIRYSENESNYCPKCQTGGKLLADRALSRLLKASWPKAAED
jgi:formamidopyrimidine-DNA glycosylase